MLEKDDWKFAIEDARTRHKAILDLIQSAETQALSLLRLFLTTSIAAAGAAFSIFFKIWDLPTSTAVGFSCASITMLAASIFCALATLGGNVNLPGKGAEFWLWASHKDIDQSAVFERYLRELKEKHKINNTFSDRQANYLGIAKWIALAALPLSLFVGVLTEIGSR